MALRVVEVDVGEDSFEVVEEIRKIYVRKEGEVGRCSSGDWMLAETREDRWKQRRHLCL